jgi:hypothetical protein
MGADGARAHVDGVFGKGVFERDGVFDGPAVALGWIGGAV